MAKDMELALHDLVDVLASDCSIRAIGLSGGLRPLPQPGEGDIDLFIYCTEIPGIDQRKALLETGRDGFEQVEIGKMPGGHWGQGDCLLLAGVETWLLFFTIAEAENEMNAILDGQYLGRLDQYYYPIGRLAMWKIMRMLHDPDQFLGSIKERIRVYPDDLSQAVLEHHVEALGDVEDLERAVNRRDVFFFHFTLDLALDHFLQAVFALNKEYFPSRKRSEDHLKSFAVKPLHCEQRLRQVVELGGKVRRLIDPMEFGKIWCETWHPWQRNKRHSG